MLDLPALLNSNFSDIHLVFCLQPNNKKLTRESSDNSRHFLLVCRKGCVTYMVSSLLLLRGEGSVSVSGR